MPCYSVVWMKLLGYIFVVTILPITSSHFLRYIVEKDKAHLFIIKLDKISQEIEQQLAEDGIELHDYHLFLFLMHRIKKHVFQ